MPVGRDNNDRASTNDSDRRQRRRWTRQAAPTTSALMRRVSHEKGEMRSDETVW
jgi:hypothetical protein